MEETKLTPEQINEVNFRVREIIGTFREGLYNSAAFDYANYWSNCMNNNGQMSEACKHVYETKERVMSMLDKETELVCRDDMSIYETKKRVAKNKIITSIMNFLEPALRGRESEHKYIGRVVDLSEFTLDKGEELHNIKFTGFLKNKI